MTQSRLSHVVRDNTGRVHKRGEQVIVIGYWRELGTHRELLRAKWQTGEPVILLPQDIEGDEV